MAILCHEKRFLSLWIMKDNPTLCENYHVDGGQTKQIGAIVNAHAYYLPSLNVYQHPISSSAMLDCWTWAAHGWALICAGKQIGLAWTRVDIDCKWKISRWSRTGYRIDRHRWSLTAAWQKFYESHWRWETIALEICCRFKRKHKWGKNKNKIKKCHS